MQEAQVHFFGLAFSSRRLSPSIVASVGISVVSPARISTTRGPGWPYIVGGFRSFLCLLAGLMFSKHGRCPGPPYSGESQTICRWSTRRLASCRVLGDGRAWRRASRMCSR